MLHLVPSSCSTQLVSPPPPPTPPKDNMAEEAKEAGNAAFKGAEYEEAIKHFSSAIEADATNHLLFSNRSAAYAKLDNFKNALLDANKCIALKPEWSKGHSRRGAAYVGLRNWRAAHAAYETALQYDPENQAIKSELEQISLRLSGGHASSAASAAPSAGSVPGSSPGASYLHATVLLLSLFFFLPVLGMRYSIMCYRLAIGCVALCNVRTLYLGWPRTMATLKDARFHKTHEAQSFWISLMMIISQPLPFALIPLVCYSAHTLAASLSTTVIPKLPAFAGERMRWLISSEGTQTMLAFAAISEVMVVMMAPVQASLTSIKSHIHQVSHPLFPLSLTPMYSTHHTP